MHRRPLLELIDRYAVRYPEEHALVTRFRNFVAAHEDCLERSLTMGHVTGSAWLVDATGGRLLLTHHRKLGKWLQLGGHADGEADLLQATLREAWEESGLEPIEPVEAEIFDLDIHVIPARKQDAAHEHFDVRFALRHPGDGKFHVSDESHELAWAPITDLSEFTDEPSILRMARKWLGRPE